MVGSGGSGGGYGGYGGGGGGVKVTGIVVMVAVVQ